MKTTAVLVLLVAFTVSNCQSQTWSYGLKTDLNYAGMRGTGIQSGLNYNFQGGFFAEKKIHSKWSLQTELLYSQNNFKKTSDFLKYYPNSGNYYSNSNIYLSYISVPVLVKYNVYKFVSLHAGPQYGVRVQSNENLLKQNADAFSKNELSVNAGIEARLRFITFYVRYNRGINDLNNIDDRYNWKMERIQTGIAVKLL